MDEHTLIKLKTLSILNEFRKNNGPNTRKSLKDVANELSIDFDKFMNFYGNELYTEECIYMDSGCNAFIKPKGIAIVEKNNPFYNEYRNTEVKNLNVNAPIIGSAVIQGNENSVNIAIDFLANIEREIEKSNLSPKEKKIWLKRIKEISSHPVVSQIFLKVIELLVRS